MAELRSLTVGDDPFIWRDLGFELTGDRCRVGATSIRLGATGRGVLAWEVSGVGTLSELAVEPGPPEEAGPGPAHPNGVMALDHVVVATPDVGRTVAAFERSGLPLRRTRRTDGGEGTLLQAFFRLENTVVEVVGPPEPSGGGPARFYGLAFAVADLDVTAAHLGARLRPARAAVQPGRRIATLDRAAGSTVPVAFMSAR